MTKTVRGPSIPSQLASRYLIIVFLVSLGLPLVFMYFFYGRILLYEFVWGWILVILYAAIGFFTNKQAINARSNQSFFLWSLVSKSLRLVIWTALVLLYCLRHRISDGSRSILNDDHTVAFLFTLFTGLAGFMIYEIAYLMTLRRAPDEILLNLKQKF